ncbi:hypothetical protein D3C75_1338870 [compost metagenome]
MHQHTGISVKHSVTRDFAFFLREEIVLQLAQINGQCYCAVILTAGKCTVIIEDGQQGYGGSIVQCGLP